MPGPIDGYAVRTRAVERMVAERVRGGEAPTRSARFDALEDARPVRLMEASTPERLRKSTELTHVAPLTGSSVPHSGNWPRALVQTRGGRLLAVTHATVEAGHIRARLAEGVEVRLPGAKLHELQAVSEPVVRGVALDGPRGDKAHGRVVGRARVGDATMEVVFDHSTRRFETVPQGIYRPLAHGSSAARADALVGHAADRVHAEIAADIATLRARNPAQAERMSKQVASLYSTTRTPEEQLLLMRVLVASGGDLVAVRDFQRWLQGKLGDKISDGRAVLALGMADGLRDMRGDLCAKTATDEQAVTLDPREAQRFTAESLRAEQKAAGAAPTLAQAIARINQRLGHAAQATWSAVAVDAHDPHSLHDAFALIAAHLDGNPMAAPEGVQVFVGGSTLHALVVKAVREESDLRGERHFVFEVRDPETGVTRDMGEAELAERGLFGIAKKSTVALEGREVGAEGLQRAVAGKGAPVPIQIQSRKLPFDEGAGEVAQLADGNFVSTWIKHHGQQEPEEGLFIADANGVELKRWPAIGQRGAHLLRALPDGGFVAATIDGNLTIYEADGSVRAVNHQPTPMNGNAPSIMHMEVSADGSIFTTGKPIVRWSPKGDILGVWPSVGDGHAWDFAVDGTSVWFTAGDFGTPYHLDTESGQLTRVSYPAGGRICDLVSLGGGRVVLTNNGPSSVSFINATTDRFDIVKTVPVSPGFQTTIQVMKIDENTVAVTDTDGFRFFDRDGNDLGRSNVQDIRFQNLRTRLPFEIGGGRVGVLVRGTWGEAGELNIFDIGGGRSKKKIVGSRKAKPRALERQTERLVEGRSAPASLAREEKIVATPVVEKAPPKIDLSNGERFGAPLAPIVFSGTPEEAKLREEAITKLVRFEKPAGETDTHLLTRMLNTFSLPMLQELAAGNFTVVVTRDRVTNVLTDSHGRMNTGGGVSGLTDLAEGMFDSARRRIVVRSFIADGQLRIDAGTLLHEIGHAYDYKLFGEGGAHHLSDGMTKAFNEENTLLDKYFQVPHEFAAETFAQLMLDSERSNRLFPAASRVLGSRVSSKLPDTARLAAIQHELSARAPVSASPDPYAALDALESHNATLARDKQSLDSYVFSLVGENKAEMRALAQSLGDSLRHHRAADRPTWGTETGLVRVSAATFNDPKLFGEVLDKVIGTHGAFIYLSDLSAIPSTSPGFQVLEHRRGYVGGLAVMLAGNEAETQRLAPLVKGVVSRQTFEMKPLDKAQVAEAARRLGTDEGYTFSAEAVEALEGVARGKTFADSQALLGRIKVAQGKRLAELSTQIDQDPLALRRFIKSDVLGAANAKDEERDPLELLDRMTGLKDVKAETRKLVNTVKIARSSKELGLSAKMPRANLLFAGPPGTGKTTVAELLVSALHREGFLKSTKIAKVRIPDLLKNPEQDVKALFENNKGGAIFIDEMHQLRDTPEGQRAFRAMIPYLGHPDYAGTAFIGAGYKGELNRLLRDVDDGAERRFKIVDFPNYEVNELGTILDKMLADQNMTVSPEAREVALAALERQRRKMKNFGNAGSVEKLVEGAITKQRDRLAEGLDSRAMTREDLTTLTTADFTEPPRMTKAQVWQKIDGLTGLQAVKEKLKQIAAMTDFARKMHKDPWDFFEPYFIFDGAAGTGKTTVARLVGEFFEAYDLLPSADVVETSGGKLTAGYVGQTTDKVSKVFDDSFGGVLFIDEVSGLAKSGGTFKDEAVKEMLKQLEDGRGKRVVVVADYPENINEFLDMDPGLERRFASRFSFASLNATEASEQLGKLLHSRAFDTSAVEQEVAKHMPDLVAAPNWASSGDVRTLANEIVKRQAEAYAKATLSGGEPAPAVLMPEAVSAAFADLIAKKVARGSERAARKEEVGYATETQSQKAHATHAHGADNDIARMYSDEERDALGVIQDVVAAFGLQRDTVGAMAQGMIPAEVLQDIMRRKNVSEARARELVKIALEATVKVEAQLQQQAQPAPVGAKLEKEVVCIACGKVGHGYQPVENTYFVGSDGKRKLVNTKRMPGTGW